MAGALAWSALGLLLLPEGVWRLARMRQSGARLGPLRLRWQARRSEVRRACLVQAVQAIWLGAVLAGLALALMAMAQAWLAKRRSGTSQGRPWASVLR